MIYTAITNNYELPRTDIVVLTTDICKDPQRSARLHKCIPPKTDYSLWIDGNTSLKVSMDFLIATFLQKHDICVFQHPIRDCIYEEAKICIDAKLDDKKTICDQVERYEVDEYPAHNGLAATTYVLRRHTSLIEQFNNMWWAEISKGSKRDQLSFNYCCWKLGIEYNIFPETHYDNFKYNRLFHYKEHGK